jgi:hypothetical protein
MRPEIQHLSDVHLASRMMLDELIPGSLNFAEV